MKFKLSGYVIPLALVVITGCLFLFGSFRRVSNNYLCLMSPERAVNKSSAKFIDGIPFLLNDFWKPGEGDSMVINTYGLSADQLYIHGALNSVDRTNPAWGGGNGFKNFFFGTQTGRIKIKYVSGRMDVIPLIVGYTSWIYNNYKISPEPFKSHPRMAGLLDNALCVANGLRGYKKGPQSYFLVINLRHEKIDAITLCDNAGKVGYYKVDGLSFKGVMNKGSFPGSTFSMISGHTVPDSTNKWIKNHVIESVDGYPSARRNAIDKLRYIFDTQPSDINYKTIRKTKPDISAGDFTGPKVKFAGSPTAALMTNIYYENAHEILGRVDDSGMVHESAKGADNFNGIGTWTAHLGPFYQDSYTRTRSIMVLSNMGFSKKANAAIDYYDRWMMWFPRHYPEIQLGGKPVPAHATVIANMPLVYFDQLRKVGWPTKYKTHDFGNGENDGHGMLMLSRWRAWVKQGRQAAWVNKRWNVIKAAAEYIPWCLDNPKLSFSEHGLLYSESEGGMEMESMFCDFNCYIGLLSSVDMAKSTGRIKWARRWKKIADDYLDSMNAYYPVTIKPWGDVWDPHKTADWIYGHATLAPVFIGMEYWGYNVMHKLPPGWLKRTKRTYKMQLTRNKPPFAAPAGMGYGQGYITQAGLLLDQMNDATHMVDWMAKFCFAPRLQHPYRVPEGAIVESDGSVWRRWGDLGNLYQVGEIVYTIQVILGIDDLDARELVLMPRMPLDWNEMNVSKWPVRTFSNGHSQLIDLSMKMKRDGKKYSVTLQSKKAVDKGKIRVGPFNISVNTIRVICNGKQAAGKLFTSGDSKWVWVHFGNGETKHFKIVVQAL